MHKIIQPGDDADLRGTGRGTCAGDQHGIRFGRDLRLSDFSMRIS